MANARVFLVLCCVVGLWACGAGPRAVREQQRREAELAAQDVEDDEPYTVAASHILITFAGADRADPEITRTKAEAQALARELLDRIRAGEDFAALAQQYSDGPSGKNGGSLGTFSRSKMTQAFSDAVFSLDVGELADAPVETEYGFHVIRRDK